MIDVDLFNAMKEARDVEHLFEPGGREVYEAPVLSDVVFPLTRIIKELVREVQNLREKTRGK